MTWEDPADDAAGIAWVRDYRIRAAFGAEKYERLAQIKAEYDPNGPAPSAGVRGLTFDKFGCARMS